MASLTALGGILHEEHFRIIAWVSELQCCVAATGSDHSTTLNEAEERHQLRQLLAAIDDFLRHHAFEEEALFPLIADGVEEEIAGYLADEHAAIDPMLQRLDAIAREGLQDRADNGYWSRFRHAVNELYSDIIEHLEREEEFIVQRLCALLDTETDRRLARQHAADPLLFGVGTQ